MRKGFRQISALLELVESFRLLRLSAKLLLAGLFTLSCVLVLFVSCLCRDRAGEVPGLSCFDITGFLKRPPKESGLKFARPVVVEIATIGSLEGGALEVDSAVADDEKFSSLVLDPPLNIRAVRVARPTFDAATGQRLGSQWMLGQLFVVYRDSQSGLVPLFKILDADLAGDLQVANKKLNCLLEVEWVVIEAPAAGHIQQMTIEGSRKYLLLLLFKASVLDPKNSRGCKLA
jgi:hypothetical protein